MDKGKIFLSICCLKEILYFSLSFIEYDFLQKLIKIFILFLTKKNYGKNIHMVFLSLVDFPLKFKI